MQNRLNNLIDRANSLAERDTILGFEIPKNELTRISNELKIVLPTDFSEISTEISVDSFSTMQFSHVLNNKNEIIEDNKRLRKWYAEQSDGKSDMSHVLVLADDDGGSVFMITQDSPEKPTPVIWCDAGDMYHYSINGVFPHPHDEWPSFTDFFEYLVEKEEEKLRENNS
jgi:hypothetical protein